MSAPRRSPRASDVRRRAVRVEPSLDPQIARAAGGALLGTFVGDALGMPFEGASADVVPVRLEMLDARLGRGTYTDDTQMALALAESIVRCGVVDEEDLARTFLEHHDPVRGYGQGTTEVLRLWNLGVGVEDAAAQAMGGRGSLGNGAAMRVAPVGIRFYDDPVLLDQQARRSAWVTHRHELAIDGAAVQAAAVAAAADRRDPLAGALSAACTREFRATLGVAAARRRDPPEPAELAELLGAGWTAHESVPTAVFAAAVHDDFEQAVTYAIRCGGDADTLGAMTGAIAGARSGIEAIPGRWLDAIEDGERGRAYAETLAFALAKVAADPAASSIRR